MSEQVQLWETYNDKGFKAKLSEFAEKDAAGNDIATSLGNRYTKGETDTLLNGKEDKIADLDTIRSNASKGATAIQGVQRNGTDLAPDASSKVNVEVPVLGIQVNNADVTPDQSTKKVNLTVLDTISAGSDYPVSSKTIYTALDDIYTKAETNAAIAAAVADFGGFKVVTLGPDGKPAEQSPSTKIIYLTKDSQSSAEDPYTEWICTNTTGPVWEIIGETSVDLSQYYTKTEADALLANKVTVVIGKGLSTEDYSTVEKAKLAGISDGANKVESSQTNGNIKVDGTETTVYAHPAGSENVSGLYKVATDSTGHVTSATAVVKSDITDLGIPAQDTTYESKTAAQGGTDVSLVTTGEKYIWNQKYDLPVNGIPKNELAQGVQDSLDAADTALQPADIDGYWNGAVIDSGSGNVVSGVSVDSSTGRVTVTKTSIVPSDSTPLVASGNGDAGSDTEYARADHVHPAEVDIDTETFISNIMVDPQNPLLDDQGNPIVASPDVTLVSAINDTEIVARRTREDINGESLELNLTGGLITGIGGKQLASAASANNGALNITVGSSSPVTFTANQPDNSPVNLTIPVATSSTEGLMSVSDKVKLAGIDDGAEVNDIATISLNGSPLTPDANRNVEITVTSPSPSSANPVMDGNAAPGTSTDYARADHVHPSDSTKADKVSGATNGNFAGLDANGNLVDSGSKATDFATAAQGALADTAYQKPSTGIPSTDLDQASQTSLGLADTAYQKPSTGIPSTDLEQAAQNSLALADTAYQKPSTGIPSTDLDQASQTSLGLADTAVQDANYVHTDNNYTAAEKDKLGNIEAGAQVNVQADWEETNSSADSYIQNKPASVSMVAGTGISITEDQVAGTMTIASTVDTSTKADKVSGATSGNFAALDSNGNLIDSTKKASDFKTVQTAVADPTASGTAVSFIDTISQDANGEITVTKKTVQNATASTSGVGGNAGLLSAADKETIDNLATVATTGNYSDLNGTPTIPAAANDGELSITIGNTTTTFTANQSNNASVSIVNATYDDTATPTTYTAGLMTGEDKETLDNLATAATNKADKVSGAHSGNFAGLDNNGNLTDSGSNASSFATAAQGTKADTAYQLPANGIPETDLESAVQTSLGLADTAYQLPANGIPSTDLESSVQTSLGLADTAVQPATLNDYVQKETGKGLSTNDYTQADKDIVDQVGDAIPQDADSSNPLVTNTVLQQAIANFGGFEVVPLDPNTHEPDVQGTISDKIIYLTKESGSSKTDPYTEWIYQNSSWEIIGETSVDLNGYIKSVSMAGGSAISPVSGATTIDLPAAANNSGTGTDGIMSGADKVKLDGIATGAEVNTIASISLNGTGLTPDANRNVEINVTSPSPSDANPAMDGTAAAGVSGDYSRADHVHPSDTNKQDVLTFNTAYDPSSNKAATMSDVTGAVASKADVVSGATSGNLAALDGNGNLVDSQVSPSDFKTVQTAVVDPTASGNTVSFIDTISQNTNGEISVTKKTVSDAVASSSGVGGSAGLLSAADKETIDSLATVATTGDYNDLTNKPTIPAAQVNSDWDASSGVAEILHKPTIGDGTLSITVGSASAQTFTANQETNESITIPLAAVDNTGATPVYTEGLMSAADKAKVEGIADKADKVTSATPNNFASLTSGGNLADSGYSANSFATAAQGALADSSIQGVTVDNGSPLTPVSGVVNIDLSGKVDKVTGKGLSTNDYTAADKEIVDNAYNVIPSDATDTNQLVSYDTMTAALANFIGMKVSNGTGADMHPDEQNPNTKTIYLVYDSSATGGDKYKEWIYSTTNTWTLIGDTTVDLSGYVQYPSTHTDTHLVAFGPNDSIADTGKTVADLTNSVETVSIGSGSGISPTSGTTDINIPLAANNNGTGTDGAMAGADKVKLDGIASGAQVNTVNTVSIGNGSGISPTSGTTDINIPLAANNSGTGTDGAMAGADKVKLDGITAGAEPNVQANWTEADSTSDAYIANKPNIIIPQDSPAAQGGISAPKYLMVVTSMPAAANIDPDTIYLVQGTYIGT